MRICSKCLSAEEAAPFENDLMDHGFTLVVKEEPSELHRKEYMKKIEYRHGGTPDYLFLWVD